MSEDGKQLNRCIIFKARLKRNGDAHAIQYIATTMSQQMPAGGVAVDTTGDGRADSIIPVAYGQQVPQVVQAIPMMQGAVPMAQPVQAVPL